ncbi:MAG TPA: hypothetical protein O0W87_04325 [Methanocorpusculum sp.]|nr:hypothetical protein [Methanocorpusculum sp.]
MENVKLTIMVGDLSVVNYDPDLHRYHRQHWDAWVESEEYGTAFKAYWKNGTIPRNKYPKTLIIKNKKDGTVSYVQLNGTHDWDNSYHDINISHNFMKTAIYNKQLAAWYNKREKSKARKHIQHSTSKFTDDFSRKIKRLSVLQILTWVFLGVIAYIFLATGNSYPVPDWLVNDGAYFLFPITTVLLIISFIRSYGILPKITYALFAFICGIISLGVFDIISAEDIFYISIAMFIGIIVLIVLGFRLLMVALFYGAKWFGVGFGGTLGARTGWDFSDRLFGKR